MVRKKQRGHNSKDVAFSTLFHGFLSQKTRKSLRLGVFARDIFFGCGYAALV